jgi:hypothetical protein
LPLGSIADASELEPVDCADRLRSNHYLVVNKFGDLGTAFTETDGKRADLETLITDLMSGQYSDPVRVVASNTCERWSEDASEDIAREIVAPP